MQFVFKESSSEDRSVLIDCEKLKLHSLIYRTRLCFKYTTQRNISRITLTCFVDLQFFYGRKIKVLVCRLIKYSGYLIPVLQYHGYFNEFNSWVNNELKLLLLIYYY